MRADRLLTWGAISAALTVFSCAREPRAEHASRAARKPPLEQTARPVEPRSAKRDSGPTRASSGIAVLELFTSEGCSSCPAADRALSSLAQNAAAKGLPIYALSFHVDYWNYLGWRDRFSDALYSERQRGYAALASGNIYTPQLVVNGEAECVGSDASCVQRALDSMLNRASRTTIELVAQRHARHVELSYRVTGETRGRVLNLALVEARVESQVSDGENAGRRLTHVNVVRAFRSLPLSAGSEGQWAKLDDSGGAAQPLRVIAYAETTAQRDVSGAAALDLR